MHCYQFKRKNTEKWFNLLIFNIFSVFSVVKFDNTVTEKRRKP